MGHCCAKESDARAESRSGRVWLVRKLEITDSSIRYDMFVCCEVCFVNWQSWQSAASFLTKKPFVSYMIADLEELPLY
jgi:hypothetical protein